MSLPPLPLKDWHCRWFVFPESWSRLHRLAEMMWDDDDPHEMISGTGRTVCGKGGRLIMPGFGSRMGLPRCAHCCRALGIPQGLGAPWNNSERLLTDEQRAA